MLFRARKKHWTYLFQIAISGWPQVNKTKCRWILISRHYSKTRVKHRQRELTRKQLLEDVRDCLTQPDPLGTESAFRELPHETNSKEKCWILTNGLRNCGRRRSEVVCSCHVFLTSLVLGTWYSGTAEPPFPLCTLLTLMFEPLCCLRTSNIGASRQWSKFGIRPDVVVERLVD
jgi:hypothetical protein